MTLTAAEEEASLRIDRLLSQGKEECHNVTKDEVDAREKLPDDPDLVKVGQEFFQNNLFALFACMLSGLMTVMYIPSIEKFSNTRVCLPILLDRLSGSSS